MAFSWTGTLIGLHQSHYIHSILETAVLKILVNGMFKNMFHIRKCWYKKRIQIFQIWDIRSRI